MFREMVLFSSTRKPVTYAPSGMVAKRLRLLPFPFPQCLIVVEVGIFNDLPPMTRPERVRVELVLQKQPEADSLSRCADDDNCTPDAIVQ